MPFFFHLAGKRSLTARCVTIIKSSGLRNSALTPVLMTKLGTGGRATVIADARSRSMTNFGRLRGFLQSAAVRSIPRHPARPAFARLLRCY
jgi:hypothetical protein